ncbi:MAG: enoyl-CoA hydratase/isomerase family protein, partial [Mycobacterium sp.]
MTRRVENGVAWITLNRPDAGNAMTPFMRDQIGDWMIGASGDLAVRAVVITGSGTKGFCTGADLRAPRAAPPPPPKGAPERVLGDAARMIRHGWQRLVSSILDCEKPVIAGVNATAAGGGMHLALACDLVIAAEEARFIEVFVRRGIAPDAGGAYLLTRLIGPQRAKELFFFGDDVPASEALKLGLVNRVVPRAELDKTLAEWASRLAAGPTKAIGMA